MGETGAEPPPRPPEQPEAVRPGDTSPEFPWPPPAPSASTTVPGKLLPAPTQGTTLGQVADRLSTALLLEDYSQQAWFRIPQGFALVTQLEQIHADGTPVLPPDRWGDRLRPEKIRNLRDYLMGLFVAPAGRFRIIVFLVTSATVPRGAPIGREEAEQWLLSGTLELDRAMRAEPYTPDHKVLVLIYEYEKPSSSARANLVMPSALSALEHLKAAGITNALQGQP